MAGVVHLLDPLAAPASVAAGRVGPATQPCARLRLRLLRAALLELPALLLLGRADLRSRAASRGDRVARPRRRGGFLRSALSGALRVGGLRRDAKKDRER